MKICISNDMEKRLVSKNKKVLFGYDYYIDGCKKIANDIKEKYGDNLDDIELIGVARGGLPMLVTISHLVGIRRVSIIQTKMSNTDEQFDFGEATLLTDNLDNSKKKCIVLDDIIFKGTSSRKVLDILKEKGKDVLSLYTFVIDENAKNIDIYDDSIEVKYVYDVCANDWVYFFWEEDIRNINID